MSALDEVLAEFDARPEEEEARRSPDPPRRPRRPSGFAPQRPPYVCLCPARVAACPERAALLERERGETAAIVDPEAVARATAGEEVDR